MASNFDFLPPDFPQLLEHAIQAEKLVYSAPRASCFYTRFALEQAAIWLYTQDPYLKLPYDNSLGSLIHEQTFRENLAPNLFPKLRTIHKIGNKAAHDSSKITSKDALRLIEDLFHFLYWLKRYYSPNGKTLSPLEFNKTLIPSPVNPPQDLTQQQLQQLEEQLSSAHQLRQLAEERQKQTQQELETLKAQITALKRQNETVPDTHNYKEADTRRYLIDILLTEAGWNINHPDATEYPVDGMPTPSGKGYIDYVLWGDNGKPLAIIEAKRTSANPEKGKHQAALYANCLQTRFGQRPLIYYTNGYSTHLWDDVNYPPRQVQGFLKKDELERLIFRRTHRKRLNLVQINANIVNRTYQHEAIRRITENLEKKHRKGLLVMATGTGKTRTAIALTDLLMKANWVNRVLFLADRNALLKQAKRAFTRHLPSVTAIDLTEDKTIEGANVVVSTYQTITNYINRFNDNGRILGVGYFDLVIVDEAHRSIYKKYRALFDYFDAFLVGLTATPRNEVHRDTYRIFDLEPGVPSFAYELSDAINDGYLVPPVGVEVPFKFLQQGVKYEDLTPEEQEEYEDKFIDDETGEIPPQINAAALNQWLFNENTVDRVLEILMERGLKIEGGDILGKTIIFARNHKHADFIVKRFDKNYPHYQGKFAQIIDSHDDYAQDLLDQFYLPNKQPTIAVSVDMLDTGVDIPEVVNLVFFKPVYSGVKFNQMIGRGTRLCLNLFGIGQDKTHFLIFDLCSNFEFFNQTVEETDTVPPESLTTRLFKTRLKLTELIGNTDPNLQQTIINYLHQHVATMESDNFLVRRHLQTVEEFANRDRWHQLTPDDRNILAEQLASLPNSLFTENRLVKEFDLRCLKLQLALLQSDLTFIAQRDKIRDLMSKLEEKQTIPMVKAQLDFIQEVQSEEWWTDVTLGMIENLRVSLRDIVKFIDPKEQTIIYTNFTDELGEVNTVNVPIHQTGFSPYQYRKKVEAYIRDNQDHLAIAKLKRNMALTTEDLESLESMLFASEAIESKERFEEIYGKPISIKLFIRQLVGLDRNAAKEAFAKYLEGTNFNANQIRFVENIIDYLTQNGVMDVGLLYEPPFTDLHHEGLDGVFKDGDADQIIDIVRSFNDTVGAKFDAA